MQENENYTIGRNITEKFEFYFIALVFTILGLAIETSNLTSQHHQYLWEVGSWGLLFISGIIGLFRLEWKAVFFIQHGNLQQEKRSLDKLKYGLGGRTILKNPNETWTTEELSDAKKKVEDNILFRKQEIKKINRITIWSYKIHQWAFALGLLILIVSRILAQLKNI